MHRFDLWQNAAQLSVQGASPEVSGCHGAALRMERCASASRGAASRMKRGRDRERERERGSK